MFYNARWYDPYITQFSQPDSIIPDQYNPQDWNRYSYARYNPVRYNDPSGHRVACEDYAICKVEQEYSKLNAIDSWKKIIKDKFGITMSDGGGKDWNALNLSIVHSSLENINVALSGKLKSLVGGATFKLAEYVPTADCPTCTYSGWTSGTSITFYTMGSAAIRQMNINHEFGHLMDNSPGMVNVFSRDPDINNPDFLDNSGYLDRSALIDKSKDMYQHPMSIYGKDPIRAQEEHWGDIFANYVAGNINLASTEGQAMNTFVTGALAPYIGTP
jgi:hypothetical protein